ncbi:helix-turn-helix domain-containing protein [Desmospora profundinema]|uniref:DNA-binding transcriptional ArsR family regulator n=1 Tax=Desmospora profundinema TaxID=1571184 RepID=A0ABU1IK93_9BACL|nr:helix-turn-helix domain-containing protein [Desmospora profundinema]MDR6225199.1 DNA-binding transcriptional ArsR family regulator [Desmospora profundinema]
MPDILETYRVESAEQAAQLLHPLRGEILSRLTQPASATEVARELGEPPQRINYHMKALEKAGLVQRAGTRQIKNLVEVLYLAIARTYILSDTLGLGETERKRLRDQRSLTHLLHVSERIKSDTIRLLDYTDEGREIPSAALHTSVCLADETERKQFLEEYVELVRRLAAKYQRDEGTRYNLTLAAYPQPGKESD